MQSRRMGNLVAMAAVLALSASTGSCVASLGGKGAVEAFGKDVPEKYTAYIERCDQYTKDVEEAEKYIEETPGILADKLGLKHDATLDEVTEAIRSRIQDQVVKVGAHVEITIEGGVEAHASAEAGTDGASAEAGASAEVKVEIKIVGEIEVSPELAELIDAAKTAITRLVVSAKKLKALSVEAPDLVKDGAALVESAPNDIQNPVTSAKVVAKITGISDQLKKVAGLFDVSFEMHVEIKASFTLEASGSAGT